MIGYMTNIQKSVAFLYAISNLLENIINDSIQMSNNMKHDYSKYA